MKVIEEFATLQGEGKFLGVPSYFIRTTGCNLRCAWKNKDGSVTLCDTPYSSHKPEVGVDLDFKSIIDKLESSNIKHIVITGGEPMLQSDLIKIISAFRGAEYHITIETNATMFRPLGKDVFVSMSPKLSSSYAVTDEKMLLLHKQNNLWKESARQYMKENDYQFKFVVNSLDDFEEIIAAEKELNIPKDKIYIMPQGIDEKQLKETLKMVFNKCVELGYNLTPRLHIDIFGNKRGI